MDFHSSSSSMGISVDKNNNRREFDGDGDQKNDVQGTPEGCMVVMVGHEAEEPLQRFVIPVLYLNHPLFMRLLEEAEEEYWFDHMGPIIIPCDVEQFKAVQGLIEREHHGTSLHHQAVDTGRDRRHHHSQHHHFLCF